MEFARMRFDAGGHSCERTWETLKSPWDVEHQVFVLWFISYWASYAQMKQITLSNRSTLFKDDSKYYSLLIYATPQKHPNGDMDSCPSLDLKKSIRVLSIEAWNVSLKFENKASRIYWLLRMIGGNHLNRCWRFLKTGIGYEIYSSKKCPIGNQLAAATEAQNSTARRSLYGIRRFMHSLITVLLCET